jgi:hypothetical protein
VFENVVVVFARVSMHLMALVERQVILESVVVSLPFETYKAPVRLLELIVEFSELDWV